MSMKSLGAGAAQEAGKELAQAVLQTTQGQQALTYTANQAAAGAAAVVATGVAVVVAAPLAAAGVAVLGVMYGAEKLFDWLNS